MIRCDVDLFLPFESPQVAQRVARALEVETRDTPPRTRAALHVEGATLHLRIESEEVRGLRAAANSFLRWAETAASVARAAEEGTKPFKRTP